MSIPKENNYIPSEKKKKWVSRLDVQVITLVALYTLFAIIVVSQIYWKLSFNVMMSSLESRALAVAESVDEFIETETFFTINTRKDMETELYDKSIYALTNMKNATGVLYLFTAKENENGDFIYILDGLERHLDYRFPGDLIEDEIAEKMERALTDQVIMPDEILHTDWGDIFMAYLPMHDEKGQVIGVLGVEFDATEIYATLQMLNTYTPVIAIILVISAIFISIHIFRRISNPLYLDGNTKDSITGLKNRSAYDVDLSNMVARGHSKNLGMVVADINGLKKVNDRLGHSAGDNYINLVASAIMETKDSTMIAYRTGGDEFVVLVQDATDEKLKKFTQIVTSKVKSQKFFKDMRCSVACGYCTFDETQDDTLEDTFHRADSFMYEEKRRQKEAEER